MLDRISSFVRKSVATISNTRPAVIQTVIAAVFVAVNIVGYKYLGGLDFVQGWGGGIAACIATFFLMFKNQAYWFWMIVNASLWTYLFFHTGIPMLAYLQISIILFSVYGIWQWTMTKYRIGFTPTVSTDLFGAVLATGLFAYSIYAYIGMDGYAFTGWWYVELISVAFTVAAITLDAFKYKLNWICWTLSNCFSFPLFLMLALGNPAYWGPFWTIFVYQTFNCIGFYMWYKDEKRMVREGKVVFVGGAKPAGVV